MAGRVRGVYGKPWSEMAGKIPMSRKLLERLGEAIVVSIVKEARNDLAKQGRRATPRGEPEGVPMDEKFFASFGYQLSGLLSGVALTEAVLNYPGLGRLILRAVLAQDLYLVMASMLMGTTLLLIGNLGADLLLAVVDPRIKVQ